MGQIHLHLIGFSNVKKRFFLSKNAKSDLQRKDTCNSGIIIKSDQMLKELEMTHF